MLTVSNVGLYKSGPTLLHGPAALVACCHWKEIEPTGEFPAKVNRTGISKHAPLFGVTLAVPANNGKAQFGEINYQAPISGVILFLTAPLISFKMPVLFLPLLSSGNI